MQKETTRSTFTPHVALAVMILFYSTVLFSQPDSLWTKTYGGSGSDRGRFIKQTSDGGYIIAGVTDSYGAGSRDVWLIRVAPDTGEVGVENDPTPIPSSFLLHQNYPNPFNSNTTISYSLPKSTMVNVSIYNVAGQFVETLINEQNNPGFYTVEWNAKNVGSGIYFYRIVAGEYVETNKCLILK